MADSMDEEYQQTLHKAVQVSLTWIQDILTELELFDDDFCQGHSEHLLAGIEDEVKEQKHQILVILKEGKEFLDNNPDIVLDFDLQDLLIKWNTLGNKLVVLRDGFLFSREVKPGSTNVNKVLQRTNTLPFGISLKECSEIYCVKSFPCLFSCQCRIHVNKRLCPRCNRTKEYCQRNADKSWRFRSFCQHQDLKAAPELLTSENLVACKEFASLSNNDSDDSSLSSCLLCSHLQLHVSSDSLCEYHSPVDECIRYLEETAEEPICSLDLPDQQKFSKICNIASAPELSSANCFMSFDSEIMSSSPTYIPFKHDSKSQTKRRLSEPSRRIHHQDDLWPLIRHDYQYVMDTQLIETCREANGELSWDDEDLPSTGSCSFTEFINHYKELSDWLNNIQATLSHADKTRNWGNVRLNKMEEMKLNAVRKQSFNEQGGKLCKRYPEMKDEITKYVSLLNNKWDTLEQTISPRKAIRDEESMIKDLDGEIYKLRKWLRKIENKLRTQVIKSCWTLAELEERYKAHQVLQKDIESHAKTVSSVLHLCERLRLDQRACCSQHDRDSVRQVAINLERRWHAIWLQSLEWQCRLEHQISKKTGFIPPSNLDLCFSYEPVRKCRRLNSDRSVHDHYDASQTASPLSPLSEGTDIIPFSENEYEKISDNMDSLDEMPSEFGQRVESYKPPFQDRETETDDILTMPNWLKSTNDKGVMVGSTGIDELKSSTSGSHGRPEIIQDVGYSSESSVHFSNDEKQETTLGPYGESPVESYEAIVKERTYQIRNSISLTSINCNKPTSLDVKPNDENRTNTFKSCTNNSLSHLYTSPANSYYKMTPVDLDCTPESLEISDSEVLTIKDQNNLKFKDSLRTKLNFDILDVESHECSVPTSNMDYKMEEQIKLDNPNFDISDCWDISDINLTKSLNSPVVKMCTDVVDKDAIREGESVKMDQGILDPNYKSTPIPIKTNNRGDRNLLGSNNSEMTKIKIKDKVIRPKVKTSANRLASLIMDSSCDASGEYTSNDSDDEESVSSSDDGIDDVHKNVILKEVQASPKDNVSKGNAHNDSLSIQDHENKVVLRGKKRRNSDRPLSVTELYQLSNRIDLTPFSISEGALNDLSNSSMSSSYTLTHSLSMEESYRESNKEGSPNSRKKFRKFKIRGRRFGNSESEGDPNASLTLSSFSQRQSASPYFNLDKSSIASFSPKLASPNSNGRPSQRVENIHQSSSTEKIQSEGTAIGDTDIETRKQAGTESATSDRLGQSEDLCVDSSVSDQVWDNYQDPPYPSDIYSENLDDSEVKKLLEFGDDYQAFLDSQSDAGSAARLPPTVIRRSPTKARLNPECSKGLSSSSFLVDSNANDSDSDLEDLHHVIEETQGQLQYAESVLNKHNREFLEIGVHLDPQKYAELIATCQTNIKCLQVIAQHIGTEPSDYLDLVTAIVQRWEILHVQVVDRQKQVRQLVDIQKEIQRLKNILVEMESHVNSPNDSFTNLQSLENYIKDCQADCSNLHDHKQALKGINLQLHHFISENIVVNSAAHFKNDIEVLYLLWDSLHEKYRNKTNHLQCLHSKWENYNTLCKELLTILLQKQRKLNLLSISHDFPMNIAPNIDKSPNIQGLEEELEFCRSKLEPLEQLSAELLVSLQSEEARQQVKSSLQQVNTELQTLQARYQDLQPRIYHFKHRKSSESANSSWDKRTHIGSSSGVRWIPANHKSLLWRVIRAAVPIQFAIVVLYCLACLLEPHCCDSLNNYQFTFTPQLHYRYGPPPV